MAMSSIMRSRSALTGRCEGWEVIGGSSLELKVAGPSMLGIACPDRHALPVIHSPPPPKMHPPRRRPPARAGSFDAPIRTLNPVLSRKTEPSFLRHPSLAQALEIGGLVQGADLRHPVISGC